MSQSNFAGPPKPFAMSNVPQTALAMPPLEEKQHAQHVLDEVARLADAQEEGGRLALLLEERLAPVLAPQALGTIGQVYPRAVMSPLAERLSDRVEAAFVINRTLVSVLARLEV